MVEQWIVWAFPFVVSIACFFLKNLFDEMKAIKAKQEDTESRLVKTEQTVTNMEKHSNVVLESIKETFTIQLSYIKESIERIEKKIN